MTRLPKWQTDALTYTVYNRVPNSRNVGECFVRRIDQGFACQPLALTVAFSMNFVTTALNSMDNVVEISFRLEIISVGVAPYPSVTSAA